MNTLRNGDIERMGGARIKDLAKRGIVRIVNTTTKPLDQIRYTDLPEYKKHAHWKNVPISQSEAARIFGVPQATISRWAKRGLITVLQSTEREEYLDKADVAYCAEIYRERGGAGRWLFNPDRTPYLPTTTR